jgi:hypothetical protein
MGVNHVMWMIGRQQKAPRRIEGLGAGNGTRTRDFQLGKLMLYQLSYSRKTG